MWREGGGGGSWVVCAPQDHKRTHWDMSSILSVSVGFVSAQGVGVESLPPGKNPLHLQKRWLLPIAKLKSHVKSEWGLLVFWKEMSRCLHPLVVIGSWPGVLWQTSTEEDLAPSGLKEGCGKFGGAGKTEWLGRGSASAAVGHASFFFFSFFDEVDWTTCLSVEAWEREYRAALRRHPVGYIL